MTSVVLDDKTFENMDDIKRDTGATSNAEVIRRAVALLAKLTAKDVNSITIHTSAESKDLLLM